MELKLEGTNDEFVVTAYREFKPEHYVCLMPANEWFKGVDIRGFIITDTDFVVGTFLGLVDGVPKDKFISVSGRMSIAICRREIDACIIYHNYKDGGVDHCALGNNCICANHPGSNKEIANHK